MVDIDFRLLPRPRSPIHGVKMIPVNADREPKYVSKLPRESSFVSRVDPIYSMSHFESTALSFRPVEALRTYNGILPTNVIGKVDRHYLSAIGQSVPELYSYHSLLTMAALAQFHTLTTAQVAALLGISDTEAHRTLTRLFGAGILLRATLPLVFQSFLSTRSEHVWRIASVTNIRGFVQQWLDGLTDTEYMLVTDGRDISLGVTGSAGQYSFRHNLQMAEVAIRLYETSSKVAGVLGEQASALRNLVPEDKRGLSSSQRKKMRRENVGDAAVVGADGRIIIFELTTIKNPRDVIRQKATFWTLALSMSKLDFYVVFVNTNPEHDRQAYRKHILAGIHDMHGRMGSPARMIKKGQERIFISDAATHWFPMGNAVSPGLAHLECYSPASLAYYQLLPDDLKWNDSVPVINARGAITTPNWIVKEPSAMLESR